MNSDKYAVCFPGQGAHNANMLKKYSGAQRFSAAYATVADALGFSPLKRIEENADSVNANAISSLLTVLASSLAYDAYRESGGHADFLCGYSVGQYTALHAAGCFGFEELIEIVVRRAKLMDQCFEQESGSMIAIAGIPQASVEALLAELRADNYAIWISNYNCIGQYSLAGHKDAIVQTLARAEKLEPKRLVELPVGGAWHCPMLNSAMEEFSHYLQGKNWKTPSIPVINNVTGELFTNSTDEIKSELVKHLSHPVQWEKGIRTLIANGCKTFTEVGYGNVLTKFGFFIDRSLEYRTFSGEVQAVCAE